jgi:hypothetical protein
LKIKKLIYLPRVLRKQEWLFILAVLLAIPIELFFQKHDFLGDVAISSVVTLVIGGIISISMFFASISTQIANITKRKSGSIQSLYQISLIIIAVFFAICSFMFHRLIYISIYYLFVGTILYLNNIRTIISDETIGATLWERTTYESRDKKTPRVGDSSPVNDKVFENKLKIFKGDTVLAYCEFISDGRVLAKRIINNCSYAIYIASDRPFTVIEQEFRDFKGKLYCIDCFTEIYGFSEFSKTKKDSRSSILKPVSIRELHAKLREIRRRIVSQILCNKDWSALNKKEIKRVEAELCSPDSELERNNNVWIIYDSISTLSEVFRLDLLLQFLIHDTTVDMMLGRNTLLLLKRGALDVLSVSRIESFCEHIINVRTLGKKLDFEIRGSTDVESAKNIEISVEDE